MSLPDVTHEAAVLRAALALGVVREDVVAEWADERLASAEAFSAELAEVALAPRELTALREALRPLAERNESGEIGAAIRHMTLRLLRSGQIPTHAVLRMASDARREGLLPPLAARDLNGLEDRERMAAVGMAGVDPRTAGELDTVLAAKLGDARYLLSFPSHQEAAAFVAALARKMVRDRRIGESAATVWRTPPSTPGGDSAPVNLFLDAGALTIAEREFGPLPVSSRVPYVRTPQGSQLVIEIESAEALGIEQAEELLRAS